MLAARRRRRQGPHRLGYHLAMPRSTVYGVLRRHGMSRLSHTDRTSGVVIRYQRERPGSWSTCSQKLELGPHAVDDQDTAGERMPRERWRATATTTAAAKSMTDTRGRGDQATTTVRRRPSMTAPGVALQSSSVDDETAIDLRRCLVEAAAFVRRPRGADRAGADRQRQMAYTDSVLFTETAAGLGIRLKRTRRYRPQTNGKVERFNKTLLDEWAYARLYRSNNQRRRALARWLRFYNHRRPHTSLDGLTPMAILVNNAGGKHN